MLNVICAGIPRSGSTWLYNVARIVIEGRSSRVWAGWIEEYQYDPDVDFTVIKLHDKNDHWKAIANVVLCSKRDLRDIAASAISMNWARSENEMIEIAALARRLHEFWAPSATLDLSYEEIHSDLEGAIARVGNALKIDFLPQEIRHVRERLPKVANAIGRYGHDTKTLLHANHITDGRPGRWRDQLPERVADEIWRANEAWMTTNGYERCPRFADG